MKRLRACETFITSGHIAGFPFLASAAGFMHCKGLPGQRQAGKVTYTTLFTTVRDWDNLRKSREGSQVNFALGLD